MPLEVAVLVSGARHPITRRPRRAAAEAAALRMALGMDSASSSLIHAGPDASEVLPWYSAAVEIKAIHLRMAHGIEPSAPLARLLLARNIDLVLCGVRSESHFSSGLTPYHIAHLLGWPLLPIVSELSLDNRALMGTQVLSGGLRRQIGCPLPAVVTVAAVRDCNLPFAWARFRNPQILTLDGDGPRDTWYARALHSAPPRAPRLAGALFEGSAQERLSKIFDLPPRLNEWHLARDAPAAANAILDRLGRMGAIDWPRDKPLGTQAQSMIPAAHP